MPDRYVLAIDQGTSSTKCLLLSLAGAVVREASAPVPISYPRPGWVEQDAGALVRSVLNAAAACLSDISPGDVAAVGFSTQRESAVVWDRRTGEPVGPVLGWQDQRALTVCDGLREKGHAAAVREISGLPLDPMFSAAKLRWLLDHTPDAAVGTVDSWLLYALTGSHQIEVGNASRTQLLDVHTGQWSSELLGLFGVPSSALPAVTASSGALARIGPRGGVLSGMPVTAVLGDSHAALFAHGVLRDGGVKATYGTGSSVMRLGTMAGPVCTTVAWGTPSPVIAAEGNIRSSGATIAWLAAFLGVTPADVASMAVDASSDGVHLVPAFGGLAAPWWDNSAVGLISGVTLSTRPWHLARAAVESIAHQVADVVDAMGPAERLLADGGAADNDLLMQIQANLLGVPVRRARTTNLSALGAGFLAAGIDPPPLEYDDFFPGAFAAATARAAWRDAVARSRSKEAQQ
jgi:glycerol kinase